MSKYITLLFVLMTNLVFSQDFKAKVTDKSGIPIQDAYILMNNGTVHAHTNDLGIFSCPHTKVGDTLNISYLGFETEQIILTEKDFQRDLTVILKEKQFDLDQVVLSNSIRSVSQISSVDLKLNPVNSSQEILRKVPGLFIGQHAGGIHHISKIQTGNIGLNSHLTGFQPG